MYKMRKAMDQATILIIFQLRKIKTRATIINTIKKEDNNED